MIQPSTVLHTMPRAYQKLGTSRDETYPLTGIGSKALKSAFVAFSVSLSIAYAVDTRFVISALLSLD